MDVSDAIPIFLYYNDSTKLCSFISLGNGKPSRAWMGPCFDTPSCKIPVCCGIISGRDSLFRIEYEADIDFKNGTFNGNLGGIALGRAVEGCEDQLLSIELPLFQITVPPTLAGYSRTLCDQTECPQKRGNQYTLDIPFRFVTTAMTSLVWNSIKIQLIRAADLKDNI